MGKDAYEAFMRLSFIRSGSEGRTEEPFVARDGALDLPAIPVKAVVEATLHLRTIFRRRRPGAASLVQGDHCGPDAELLAAEPMVVLCIIGCVGQKTVKADIIGGLSDCLRELGRVVAGPPAHHRARKQVRCAVADYGQLGPAFASKGPVAPALDVVGTDVLGFKTGGIDSRLGALIDQPQASGSLENSSDKRLESPFFSRRF